MSLFYLLLNVLAVLALIGAAVASALRFGPGRGLAAFGFSIMAVSSILGAVIGLTPTFLGLSLPRPLALTPRMVFTVGIVLVAVAIVRRGPAGPQPPGLYATRYANPGYAPVAPPSSQPTPVAPVAPPSLEATPDPPSPGGWSLPGRP